MIEFRVLDYWVLECDVLCVRCVCGFVGEDMGKFTEHIEEFLVLSDSKQQLFHMCFVMNCLRWIVNSICCLRFSCVCYLYKSLLQEVKCPEHAL